MGKTWGVVVFLLLMPVFLHAQASLTGLERSIRLSINPEYPAPGDVVALQAESYGIDLDRSTVVWYADGKEIARGDGLKSASVTAGKLGSATKVTIVAEELGGLIGSSEVTLRPTEVDLIWQSDSYAPPYFRGRTFAGAGATIRAQTIVRFVKADGSQIPESSIIYSWYKGSTRILSGRGRSSVTAPGPALFGNDTMSVIAESIDGIYHGRASVQLSGVDPFLELYENHPLFGVLYHRALVGSVTTLEREQAVTAVPYFAPIVAPNDAGLVYEWSLEGKKLLPDPDHPETFTITTNSYSGPVGIGLTLTSAKDLLLSAKGAWELIFGESSSIFGNDPFRRTP